MERSLHRCTEEPRSAQQIHTYYLWMHICAPSTHRCTEVHSWYLEVDRPAGIIIWLARVPVIKCCVIFIIAKIFHHENARRFWLSKSIAHIRGMIPSVSATCLYVNIPSTSPSSKSKDFRLLQIAPFTQGTWSQK